LMQLHHGKGTYYVPEFCLTLASALLCFGEEH